MFENKSIRWTLVSAACAGLALWAKYQFDSSDKNALNEVYLDTLVRVLDIYHTAHDTLPESGPEGLATLAQDPATQSIFEGDSTLVDPEGLILDFQGHRVLYNREGDRVTLISAGENGDYFDEDDQSLTAKIPLDQ